jgi:hypothetical protein
MAKLDLEVPDLVEVIVVKCWQTTGMFRLKGVVLDDGYFKTLNRGMGGIHWFLAKKDYALTEADARQRVELLQKRKVMLAERSMKKLRSFDPTKAPIQALKE